MVREGGPVSPHPPELRGGGVPIDVAEVVHQFFRQRDIGVPQEGAEIVEDVSHPGVLEIEDPQGRRAILPAARDHHDVPAVVIAMGENARARRQVLEKRKKQVPDGAFFRIGQGDSPVFPDGVLEKEGDFLGELLHVESEAGRERLPIERLRPVPLDPDQGLHAPFVEREVLVCGVRPTDELFQHRVPRILQEQELGFRRGEIDLRHGDAGLPKIPVDVHEREFLPGGDLVRVPHHDEGGKGGAGGHPDPEVSAGGGIPRQFGDPGHPGRLPEEPGKDYPDCPFVHLRRRPPSPANGSSAMRHSASISPKLR